MHTYHTESRELRSCDQLDDFSSNTQVSSIIKLKVCKPALKARLCASYLLTTQSESEIRETRLWWVILWSVEQKERVTFSAQCWGLERNTFVIWKSGKVVILTVASTKEEKQNINVQHLNTKQNQMHVRVSSSSWSRASHQMLLVLNRTTIKNPDVELLWR